MATPSSNNNAGLDQRNLLFRDGSDLSDLSLFDGPTPSLAPEASSHSLSTTPPAHDRHPQTHSRGLSHPSVRRVPVGAKRSSRSSLGAVAAESPNLEDSPDVGHPKTPGSGRPLLSPADRGEESTEYAFAPYGSSEHLPANAAYDPVQPPPHSRNVSFHNDSFMGGSSTTLTPGMASSGPPTPGCPSKHDIYTRRSSWLSIWLLILSVYSTGMSGLWLVAALIQPRWGRAIHSNGSLTPSTASLVTALFAKTIELSFVTVFVTFIGQVLSRRSLIKTSKGVTLAEMSIRTWVIQPGALLTHGQTLRYAGWTFLGIISLIACICGMLYTTASDALVSPKLKFDNWHDVVLYGKVTQSYGNSIAIKAQCQTPIQPSDDAPDVAGETCISMEHAGQAYHNYNSWLSGWADISDNGTSQITDILYRPKPIASLFDNTTAFGNWIMASNMTEDHRKFGRVINNVTMAMPHAGIFAAAREERNNIQQPGELQGSGEYHIRAAIPSPAINVLCANAKAEELAPLVYVNWTHARRNNDSGIPGQFMAPADWDNYFWPPDKDPTLITAPYLNSTVLDDIFEWGKNYTRRPPTFPIFPIDYNTVVSSSKAGHRTDAIYLLTKNSAISNYTICSIRSFQAANCSTHYNVTGTASGSLEAYCEDPSDKNSYIRSQPAFIQSYSADWTDVAYQATLALSLNDGFLNANSSNARLLSQFVLPDARLQQLRPSLAEALAVLLGCTLLLSSAGSPFVHFWNYPSSILQHGAYESFNATVQSQQYTSGYVQNWQASFYIVLLLVFATNVFCLSYFIIRRGLVTDFTEPQNLFAIAVNSPSSAALSGSCGAGPEGQDLGVPWGIGRQEDGHYYIGERAYTTGTSYKDRTERDRKDRGGIGLGIFDRGKKLAGGVRHANSYEMLSNKRRSWL